MLPTGSAIWLHDDGKDSVSQLPQWLPRALSFMPGRSSDQLPLSTCGHTGGGQARLQQQCGDPGAMRKKTDVLCLLGARRGRRPVLLLQARKSSLRPQSHYCDEEEEAYLSCLPVPLTIGQNEPHGPDGAAQEAGRSRGAGGLNRVHSLPQSNTSQKIPSGE